MGRATAHSLEVAVGNMATSGGYPDPGSMTWVSFGVQEAFADFFGVGVDATNDIRLTGAAPGSFTPPTVANPINTSGGALFGASDGQTIRRHLADSLTLKFPLYNVDGSNYATHLDHPEFQLLNSVMGLVVPGAATDTVVGNAANAYTYKPTVADMGNYELGQAVSVVRNGMAEYAFVTKIDATGGSELITVHPHWEGGALTDGMTVRHCATFFPETGSVATTREVHLRFNTDDRRRYIFRAVVSEVTIAEEPDSQNSGGGVIYATLVIRPGSKTILDDNANAAQGVAFTPTGTAAATPLQSCRRIGSGLTSTYSTPGHGAATSWPVKSWSVNIKFPLDSDGSGCDPLLPESGVTRVREEVALNFVSAGVDTYDRGMADGEEHTYIVGAGPADQGFVFGLMAGHLSATEQVGEANDTGVQGAGSETITGTLRQGSWAFDSGTGDAKNKAWRLAFPIPDAP